MKEYIKPENVISPRQHWVLVTVLEDGGEDDIALCIGRWDQEPRLGMRWNGNSDNALGNPQSRGIPIWFVIPPGKFTDAIIATLPPEKQTLANTLINLRLKD